MANRVLVEYEEDRYEFGPHWTLEVQRSASGRPGLVFSIAGRMHDRNYRDLDQELTVFVDDGWAVIQPILDWLQGEA